MSNSKGNPECKFRLLLEENPAENDPGVSGKTDSTSRADELSRARAALKESENRLAGVIESAMDAILSVDERQRIVLFNPAAEKMFGRSAADALGRNINELIPPRFRSAHPAHMRSFAETAVTRRYVGGQECLFGLRADGTEFPAEISISQSESGEGKLFTAIVRDVGERRRAEEALREREERLRALLNATSDVIYRMSPDWSEMQHLDGRGFIADTAAPSKDWLQAYIFPDDHALVTETIQRAIRNKSVFELEHRVRQADGSIGWTLSRAVPRFNANGEIVDWIGMASNVTRRRCADSDRQKAEAALRESEQRLRLFIECAPAALAMFDRDMRYLQVSRRWRADYGLGDGELIGLSHYEVFPDVSEQWKVAHRRGLAGEVLRSESDRFDRADGTVQWVKWEIRPWYGTSGQIGGIVIFAEEITQRKRAEEQLQRKAEELIRSNQDLEQFAYVASHDLQEPLRMVSAYTQLLGERYRGRLDDTADTYIGYAVEGASRMQALIQDLLAFSRVGRRAHERKIIDCTGVLDEVTKNLHALVAECGAGLNVGTLPLVFADRSQMVQLFQNLIGNALKFRAEKNPVVSISAEKKGDEWIFAVADNGIGIAPEHRQRIFEIFQRLNSRADYPGNGIGLSICKKIVEQYGGRIWAESEVGKGSTFKFSLPATQLAGQSMERKKQAHAGA